VGQYIKRAQSPSGGSPRPGPGSVPAAFVALYPALWDYLSEDRFDDGKRREVATVTLFVVDGGFRACINDKANHRVGFVSGATLEGLLASLEANLATDEMDWRSAKKGR